MYCTRYTLSILKRPYYAMIINIIAIWSFLFYPVLLDFIYASEGVSKLRPLAARERPTDSEIAKAFPRPDTAIVPMPVDKLENLEEKTRLMQGKLWLCWEAGLFLKGVDPN